ncbi:hypothetical protein [Paenibacillus alkalitolerans]|uniref:hypothetical protein n=1 Tax=Paenibacillus alkalitolerans TaxID=2799335 RepID=UPI0018F4DD64|nr:hypothetical protein [Paenibacillus alkalitolerans]
MKKRLLAFTGLIAIAVMMSGVATAHQAPPCNDSDGDGSPSGYDYAQHHIVPMAQNQTLGDGGHKPGVHQGFSACQR